MERCDVIQEHLLFTRDGLLVVFLYIIVHRRRPETSRDHQGRKKRTAVRSLGAGASLMVDFVK